MSTRASTVNKLHTIVTVALLVCLVSNVGRIIVPPATPGGQPLEITIPYNPDACTKADLAKVIERIDKLEQERK